MIKTYALQTWKFLKSLQLTIVLLALLMALVVMCTLAQVDLGTVGAVNAYMRSFFVWHQFSFLTFPVPTFPGAALVGLFLTINLVGKTLEIKRTWSKAGMWLVHSGLVILFAGEFVAGIAEMPRDRPAHHAKADDGDAPWFRFGVLDFVRLSF